jgi:beta-lactamase class A
MVKSFLEGTRSTFLVVVIVILALSVGLNGVLLSRSNTPSKSGVAASEYKKYNLLSADVVGDNPNDILINFVPLRKKLQDRFKSVDAKQSFYFEYLPDGTSIRIGADQQLVAASLIKVPLAMNLYRAAEMGKLNLDATITVKADELDDAYGDLYKRGPGFTMTLRQAAQYALRQSDNTATHVIYDHVKNLLTYDEQSLARLDIDQNMEDGQAVVTARSYSSVLKGLYFSAYLSKNDSQEILKYLSQSDADNRITKNLPHSIPVAHKIGVYNANWAESDCGIIYLPKRPYILCIMVGLPEDQANDFIAEISKDVYDFVSKQ